MRLLETSNDHSTSQTSRRTQCPPQKNALSDITAIHFWPNIYDWFLQRIPHLILILLQALLKTRSTRIQKSCLTNLHLNTHKYRHMYMPIYIYTYMCICVYIYIYILSLSFSLCTTHTILSVSLCSIYAVAEHFNPNRFCQVCLAPSFPTRSPASAPDIVAALGWGSWLHPT